MQEADTNQHASEVASGERFEFGKNWEAFLKVLNEDRIRAAEQSLAHMVELQSLEQLTFADVGCGSGLFSLAARRLGARVVSFDYDPHSVACARELQRRYLNQQPGWEIQQGSVLDTEYLAKLGQFDIVYSWGVLHHTGAMWKALDNVAPLVKDGGMLFIAIYNDQGTASKRWHATKKLYNRLPGPLRFLVVIPSFVVSWWRRMVKDFLLLRPFHQWRAAGRERGMSPWHDVVDWVGGYPFEVAKPEEIFDFYRQRGFVLERLATCRGTVGCNEFVFRKIPR